MGDPSGAGLFLESGNPPKSADGTFSTVDGADLFLNDALRQCEVRNVAHDQACNDSTVRRLVEFIILKVISELVGLQEIAK